MSRFACCALAAVAACAEAPVPHGKPTAPVVVEITQRALGGDDFEITLTARPTRDVAALELVLDGRSLRVGAARAGQLHAMHVRVHSTGREVVGGASVAMNGYRRNAAASIEIGQPRAAAPLPSRIVTLPDGTRVDEVRP